MKKLLLVVDMQNDFVTGSLGSDAAQAIVPAVVRKVDKARYFGHDVIFTRDTHGAAEQYAGTQEGAMLPVPHCEIGTYGHSIIPDLHRGILSGACVIHNKTQFGDIDLAEQIAANDYTEIELCGLCSDICVVSNALILKARLPEVRITVDANACAGVTPESHKAALLVMRMNHVIVVNASK